MNDLPVLFICFMKINEHLKFVFLLFVFVLFLKLLDVPCLIRSFLGVPCPTCGMTRALISLLKLDFHSYFYYNALALPSFFSVMVLMFSEYLHRCFFYLAILILCLNLIYYFYRLSYQAIP